MTDAFRFVVPGELPSMNEIIAAANRNRHVYNAMKQQTDDLVAWEAHRQIGTTIDGRVFVRIVWHAPNRRKDPDNIVAGQKFVLDGLVQAGVLEGDGWRHIAGIEHEFRVDKDNPRVEIEITRADEGRRAG